MNFILVESSFWGNKFVGVNGWTLANNKAGRTVSECAGKTLVGGYDIFGKGAVAKKTY